MRARFNGGPLDGQVDDGYRAGQLPWTDVELRYQRGEVRVVHLYHLLDFTDAEGNLIYDYASTISTAGKSRVSDATP